jgi:hypothetical protein
MLAESGGLGVDWPDNLPVSADDGVDSVCRHLDAEQACDHD